MYMTALFVEPMHIFGILFIFISLKHFKLRGTDPSP